MTAMELKRRQQMPHPVVILGKKDRAQFCIGIIRVNPPNNLDGLYTAPTPFTEHFIDAKDQTFMAQGEH